MSEKIDIVIPDLGDFSDVEVIELLVAAGDTVQEEDGLITLETDKAAMDVPAPANGTIEDLRVKVGDKVSGGDVIGHMLVDHDATVAVKPAFDASAKSSPERASPEEASPDDAQHDDAAQDEPAADETDAGEPAAPSATQKKTLTVPDLGDFSDVEVIEVHVSAGASVALDDPLVTLETDKAAMDVPATAAGKIESVAVSVGDRVSKGSAIAVIEAKANGEPAQSKRAVEKPSPRKTSEQPKPSAPESAKAGDAALPPINEAGFSKAHASPSVRKLARELGVDLVRVKGSGLKSRILHDDVKRFVKAILTGASPAPGAALPKVPVVDFAKFGEISVEPLTRIQRISGPRLQASWINLPHVTQHDVADITELEAKRQELKGPAKEKGISLTPLAFVMKACIAALREFPKVNASLAADGESLVYKQYYHLGFAADTENGLMVPVIRDADKMDVYELAAALGDISALARDGKLKAEQLQGASFTISSLGGIGGTAFTPIVNAPEVAILGVSRSTTQPVWNGTEFVPRLILPLSFSYDHRVIDGAYAVRFTTFLGTSLADVESLIEAIP
jgi:pyruvate dehydrogenase E2 component (dihydrolipoamide acetyltransferase)